MKFTIPGQPQGKARARVVQHGGRVHSYTPEKTAVYENWVKHCYGNGRYFGDTPLRMEIVAKYAVPASYSAKKRARCLNGEIKPISKPDADNIAKCICDALNSIAYADDSRIVHLTVRKEYAEAAETVVTLEEDKHD